MKFAPPSKSEGTTIVTVEGCEYRVPEEVILSWLSLYGEVVSELVEDLFLDDPEAESNLTDGTGGEPVGTKRTGNYSVLMKLESIIPQLLPMAGRRVKIIF